jgi:hypothetical protein
VLANARCDVLQGQCLRSNAGLFYSDYPEFAETLHILTSNRSLAQALGENGRTYFRDNYAWPVIDAKYDAMLEQLRAAPATTGAIEALPGWLARHRGTMPPGREILDGLPSGPAAGPVATGARTRPEGPPRGARRGTRHRRTGRPVTRRSR